MFQQIQFNETMHRFHSETNAMHMKANIRGKIIASQGNTKTFDSDQNKTQWEL